MDNTENTASHGSSIIAGVSATETSLSHHCLAAAASSGSAVSPFRHHVTILSDELL
jgi:hypothetical protein